MVSELTTKRRRILVDDIGVYVIRCLPTNQVYVGMSATRISSRWTEHCAKLRRGKHANRKLQHAWDKYGENAFEFERVCYCHDEQEALDLEVIVIDALNALDRERGFNLTPGGRISPMKDPAIRARAMVKIRAHIRRLNANTEHQRKASACVRNRYRFPRS